MGWTQVTPETKKKIEEAAIKYGWSLASKEVAMIGYSLAAEEKDAEINRRIKNENDFSQAMMNKVIYLELRIKELEKR